MRCRALPLSVLVTVVCFGLTVLPVSAGPWARGAGNVFLSAGVAAEGSRLELMSMGTVTPRFDRSLYGEVGVGDHITLGLDLNRGEGSSLDTAFLRYTVSAPDADWQFAVDIGATLRGQDRQPDQTLARLGLSLGRGLPPGGDHWAMPLDHDGGWATLEAVGLFDIEGTGDVVWQLEGTLGLSLENGWRAALALKAEEWPGSDFLLSVAPSVMIDLSGRSTLQLGARMGLDGSDAVGLTLNLWHAF